MKEYPIEVVYWNDHCRIDKASFEEPSTPSKMVNVGFIIEENEETLTISAHRQLSSDRSNDGEAWIIIKSCITKRVKVK